MWAIQNLTIESPDERTREFRCQVKHFKRASQYGIDGGKISVLWIQDKHSGRTVANYDRGWDIEPQTACEKMAVQALANLYN